MRQQRLITCALLFLAPGVVAAEHSLEFLSLVDRPKPELVAKFSGHFDDVLLIHSGSLYRVPSQCLSVRRFVEGEQGREHAGDDQVRRFGEADQNRRFGEADENRQFSEGDSARQLSSGENQRRFNSGEDGRGFGEGQQQRQFSDGEDDRSFGAGDDNRALAGGTQERNFGDGEAGRTFAEDAMVRQFDGDTDQRRFSGGEKRLTCIRLNAGFSLPSLANNQVEVYRQMQFRLYPANRIPD